MGVDRYLPTQASYRNGSDDPRPRADNSPFSLEAVRAILWRQKAILIGLTALVVLAAFAVTLLMRPVYTAAATVQVNPQPGQLVEGQDLTTTFIPANLLSTYLRTKLEVIQSKSMAGRVYDALSEQDRAALAAAATGNDAGGAQLPREAMVGILQGGVSTDIPLDTQIISIRFSSPDNTLAARIANTYTDEFLKDEIGQSIEANSYARSYLEEQIAQTEIRLREAEIAANQYARENGILVQEPSGGSVSADGATIAPAAPTLTSSNLADVNARLIAARTRRIEAEQRWRSVANLPASRLPEVQQNSSIQSMRSELAELNSQLADLRERYRDDYPQVRELNSRIAVLEQNIASSGADIKSAIRDEFQIAQGQEQALQAELNRAAESSLNEQDVRVQLGLLERQVSSLQSQLASLMERNNQISVAANLRTSSVTMLDSASVPAVPSSPNMRKNLLLALVAGLGLASVVALLREMLDERIRTVGDAEQRLGLAGLGQTPNVPAGIEDDLDNVHSPLSEAYSSIRASIDFALGSGKGAILMFTSSMPSEGKTTTSVAIARKFAQVGRKTLLVDLDLRRPALHKAFGAAGNQAGIVDVIFGRVELLKARIPTDEANLDVIPAGAIPQNPVEILSSGLLLEFLQRARTQYDVILLDCSPVMGIADAPLIAKLSDAVVMVVEANRTKPRMARAAIRRLRDMNANILGAVVTKFRSLEAGDSYSYQYKYYTYRSED